MERLASMLFSNILVLRNLATLNNLALYKLVSAYLSLIESYTRYSIVLWGSCSKLKKLDRTFSKPLKFMAPLMFVP